MFGALIWQGHTLSKDPRGEWFLVSRLLLFLVAVIIPRLSAMSLQSLPPWSFDFSSVLSSLLLIRTLVIKFRAHLDISG